MKQSSLADRTVGEICQPRHRPALRIIPIELGAVGAGVGTQKVRRSSASHLHHLRQTEERIGEKESIPRRISYDRGINSSGGKRSLEVYRAVGAPPMNIVRIESSYAGALVVGRAHHQIHPGAYAIEQQVDSRD